jgi:hypothetical protein
MTNRLVLRFSLVGCLWKQMSIIFSVNWSFDTWAFHNLCSVQGLLALSGRFFWHYSKYSLFIKLYLIAEIFYKSS